MDLMAEQGTFFTPTIAFLPTWYATYPPVYVPELHDKYEGTLVEKELQRNYDCLREAKKRGVVMTIGSDSFSFVTPYGTCSIEEMYEFVDKIGFTPVETITCATLNGAKMCHIEDETGSSFSFDLSIVSSGTGRWRTETDGKTDHVHVQPSAAVNRLLNQQRGR